MVEIIAVLVMESFGSIGHDTFTLRGPNGGTEVGFGRHALREKEYCK